MTALNPAIGYAAATGIAQEALASGRGIAELVLERKLISSERLAGGLTSGGVIASHERSATMSWQGPPSSNGGTAVAQNGLRRLVQRVVGHPGRFREGLCAQPPGCAVVWSDATCLVAPDHFMSATSGCAVDLLDELRELVLTEVPG